MFQSLDLRNTVLLPPADRPRHQWVMETYPWAGRAVTIGDSHGLWGSLSRLPQGGRSIWLPEGAQVSQGQGGKSQDAGPVCRVSDSVGLGRDGEAAFLVSSHVTRGDGPGTPGWATWLQHGLFWMRRDFL